MGIRLSFFHIFLLFLTLSVPVSAKDIKAKFCNDIGTPECKEVTVQNQSSALVESVKVEQRTDSSTCENITKNIKANLAGGGNLGERYQIWTNTACKYDFSFKTTKGCTGDKKITVKSADFAAGRDAVILDKQCGSLKAKVKKNPGVLVGPAGD